MGADTVRVDGPGQRVPIFTIKPGRGQHTKNTVTEVSAVWCHEDGQIRISYATGEVEVHSYVAENMAGFEPAATIEIVTGKWSFM